MASGATPPGDAAPVLMTEADVAIDERLIVNGSINVRKTHPVLYRQIMLLAIGSIALGINFFVFTPTFFVYGLPNELWGAIFVTLGLGKVVFLHLYRSLGLVRATMGLSVAYMTVFSLGTMQPAIESKGSLQLPFLYLILVVFELALLFEPFINPWTAKRDA